MITVRETNERTLPSADEIAAYLKARYAAICAGAKFAPGDPVDIVARAGMTPDMAVGDTAVVVASISGTPFAHILVLNASGGEMIVQVMSDNLAKRVVA